MGLRAYTPVVPRRRPAEDAGGAGIATPASELGRRLAARIDRTAKRLLSPRLLIALLAMDAVASLVWALDRIGKLQDLGSFLHAGASYRQGLNPYAYHPWIDPQPISPEALNLNPPVSVYVFEVLTSVDETLLRFAFFVGSLALFGLALLLLTRAYPEKRTGLSLIFPLAMSGLWHMLGYLQIYAPLVLCVVVAWSCMRRGNLAVAGILIGIVIAVKPNFALWPLFLLLAGHQRVALASMASAGLLSAIPLIVDGPRIYGQWLELTLSFDGLEWASNASLMSLGARAGVPLLGQLAAVSVVLYLLARQWRLKPEPLDSSAAAIIAVLLFGPVSWSGYTLFLLPFIFSRAWNAPMRACLLMLCVPFWVVRYASLLGPFANALLGFTYGWGILLLLVLVLKDERGESVAEPERTPRKPVAAAA
ncbi:MAG TPA: glycosyltransferase family 87 protein [Dehalococcoidia bacterium]|nr:glycosyltransferase family 87 protein [Dehalococcoidia bacterium]